MDIKKLIEQKIEQLQKNINKLDNLDNKLIEVKNKANTESGKILTGILLLKASKIEQYKFCINVLRDILKEINE